MQDFIQRKNLAHFRKFLAETTDDVTRQTLLKLLAEEYLKIGVSFRAEKGDDRPS
jgi:hypothetical protein